MKNILPILTVIGVILAFNNQAEAGRIVNRRVKDAPKVCAVMKEDKFLSKQKKQVFGTLKHSVVIEDNVSILNDLGKKECQWPFEKLNIYGNIDNFNYYIDEYVDPYHVEEIYEYFSEASTDSLSDALTELGEDEYTEEEIRLVRIKFMSEVAN